MQTAGDALNFHPHLHGILADGYWKGDVFTRFPKIDIAALNLFLGAGLLLVSVSYPWCLFPWYSTWCSTGPLFKQLSAADFRYIR
jgi:hypothetical protein